MCASMDAYIVSVVILSITMQRESIKYSDKDIKRQNERYDEIKKWLEDIGFRQKNQIKQLCRRCEIEVINYKEKDSRRKNFIDKLFNLFLIPVFVAVISWIFSLKSDMSSQVELVMEVGIAGIVLYVLAYGILECLNPFINKKFIRMQKMIEDIHGVLDRKFVIEDEDVI